MLASSASIRGHLKRNINGVVTKIWIFRKIEGQINWPIYACGDRSQSHSKKDISILIYSILFCLLFGADIIYPAWLVVCVCVCASSCVWAHVCVCMCVRASEWVIEWASKSVCVFVCDVVLFVVLSWTLLTHTLALCYREMWALCLPGLLHLACPHVLLTHMHTTNTQ